MTTPKPSRRKRASAAAAPAGVVTLDQVAEARLRREGLGVVMDGV